jgi:hypothetical protein
MTTDEANRRAVRKYLLNGEQPKDGPVLVTRTYPQRTYVIAKDSRGYISWAFHITQVGQLYSSDGHVLACLENEETKKERTPQ